MSTPYEKETFTLDFTTTVREGLIWVSKATNGQKMHLVLKVTYPPNTYLMRSVTSMTNNSKIVLCTISIANIGV